MPKLCPISSRDCKTVYLWRNSANVSRYMYNQCQIPWDEHTNWFNEMLNSALSVYWTIEVERKKIGLACINDINYTSGRGNWAFYIAEENYRGAGIGSAVELFVTNHGFNFLHLNKIDCEVLCWNKSIIRMHQSLVSILLGKNTFSSKERGKQKKLNVLAWIEQIGLETKKKLAKIKSGRIKHKFDRK